MCVENEAPCLTSLGFHVVLELEETFVVTDEIGPAINSGLLSKVYTETIMGSSKNCNINGRAKNDDT